MSNSMWFEDFLPGWKAETPAVSVTERDISDFAFRFDPQSLHLDAEGAAQGPFEGLIASGFHTLSLSFAQFFRLGLLGESNLGSPGMEEVRWLRPLRAGDTIHVGVEVTAVRASQSRPDRGVVWMRHDTFNQKGELILTVNCMHMLKRRVEG